MGELAAELAHAYYSYGKRHCQVPPVILISRVRPGALGLGTVSHSLAPESTRVNVCNVAEKIS
ncbi:hypothetical protein GCM10009589_22630 [Arthrobacter pascens]